MCLNNKDKTLKKPKIMVIGIGSTGVSLIDNLTKTNARDIQ